jgi:hypothetical protein
VITKFEILELFDDYSVIGPRELGNYFGMGYAWAAMRINKLKKAGLVEPLGVERGRWVLSVEGYKRLDYLRTKRQDDESTR